MLKVSRAQDLLLDMEHTLKTEQPFRYKFEMERRSGICRIGPVRNEPAIGRLLLVVADIIHNLRTSIDYGYFAVVSPKISTKHLKHVQFPVSESASQFDEVCRRRMADKVGQEFIEALKSLRPYRDTSGNRLLAFIHFADTRDKHRDLVVTGHYVDIDSNSLLRQLPGFPENLRIRIGDHRYDLQWKSPSTYFTSIVDGAELSGDTVVKYLDVPVVMTFQEVLDSEIVFSVESIQSMVDVTNEVLRTLRAFR
jgi:hypothetical protein